MTLILEEELHLANRIRATLPSPFPPLFCGRSLSIYLNGDSQAPTVGVSQDQCSATLTLNKQVVVCGPLLVPDQFYSTDMVTVEGLGSV